ncbi:fimbrial biogenesis chaperone [Iningainema tapete]|uniref:Molecular chaperone n=1 Tax=Iningainema tapete BLCC-T55 TaxID=2748662 RepID=A0A8J6XJD6_9CYAN|nr:fimbria/pilus periplasmic chaperone [Iningainema tapete]MBD2775598.1 molecular chaperone [Iningainema tapete BLCC-T55]
MKFSLRHILFTWCLLLLGVQPALAFKLLPMSRVFTPSGLGATQSYEIVNDANEPLAVEMSVVKRQMDVTGRESYSDADDDFLIYPPQILLKAGEKQTVRVTWLGDSKPTLELAYRLIAQQVPIELQPNQNNQTRPVGQVKILMRYMGSIFIRPSNVQQKVVVDTVKLQKGNNGANELAITLNNQGNARAILKKSSLHLTAQGQGTTVHLNPEQLVGINNAVILAGNKRRFVIPWPVGLPVGEVSATFNFEQGK